MFSRSLLFVSRLASRLKTSNVTSYKSANTTKCFLLFQIMNLWELVGWFLQWCCSSWASQSLSVSAWPSKDTARVQMCKRKSESGLYSLCAQTHLTAPHFPQRSRREPHRCFWCSLNTFMLLASQQFGLYIWSQCLSKGPPPTCQHMLLLPLGALKPKPANKLFSGTHMLGHTLCLPLFVKSRVGFQVHFVKVFVLVLVFSIRVMKLYIEIAVIDGSFKQRG